MKESNSPPRYFFVIAYALILGSSWFALWAGGQPFNPWLLVLVLAGVLTAIGITLYKQRAGHFDK